MVVYLLVSVCQKTPNLRNTQLFFWSILIKFRSLFSVYFLKFRILLYFTKNMCGNATTLYMLTLNGQQEAT